MELSLGLFFGNQGQIGQPLSEEISLLKCSSRSKQKILGLVTNERLAKATVLLFVAKTYNSAVLAAAQSFILTTHVRTSERVY